MVCCRASSMRQGVACPFANRRKNSRPKRRPSPKSKSKALGMCFGTGSSCFALCVGRIAMKLCGSRDNCRFGLQAFRQAPKLGPGRQMNAALFFLGLRSGRVDPKFASRVSLRRAMQKIIAVRALW